MTKYTKITAILAFVMMLPLLAVAFSPVSAQATEDKVDICHLNGNGSYNLINVSVDAVNVHIAHGDGYLGANVPNMPGYYFNDLCTPTPFPSGNLNDRNAVRKGGFGSVEIEPNSFDGIVRQSYEVFNLTPNQDYFVWSIIQSSGTYDSDLTISPNCFRSTHTTNEHGAFAASGSFPGPAAALSPGIYRVDVFVAPTEPTTSLDGSPPEADLIRTTNLNGFSCGLIGLDIELSSEPFETGIVVVVE
jgi:hypothetical protein